VRECEDDLFDDDEPLIRKKKSQTIADERMIIIEDSSGEGTPSMTETTADGGIVSNGVDPSPVASITISSNAVAKSSEANDPAFLRIEPVMRVAASLETEPALALSDDWRLW
jgi:hypothetical protein